MGALDFAGGTVVHINAGAAALVGALILGRRREKALLPGNLTLVVTGAGLLWFGWFGFNAGSALGANGLAGAAFINTNTATAVAALSWMFVEWLHSKKPTVWACIRGSGRTGGDHACGGICEHIRGDLHRHSCRHHPFFAVAFLKRNSAMMTRWTHSASMGLAVRSARS